MSKKYFFVQSTGALYPKWDERLLGEVAEVVRGNGLSKSSLSSEGTRECILYGELFTKYTTVIKNVVSRTNEISSVSSQIGDILMPTSDVTPDGLAKASVIFKKDVLLGSDMNIIRVKPEVNSLFMGYQINHKKEEIIKRVSGSSVKHIYARNLLDIPYVFPSLVEQEKIAEFFSALDERIALTADKVKLLKEQKAGYLQRIFAQEMVFTDDNGDKYPEWEQKKLGKMVSIATGKKDANAMVENGEYKFFTCSRETYNIDTYTWDCEAILMAGNGNIGEPKYYKGKFDAYQRTYILHDFEGILPLYLMPVIDTIFPKVVARETQTGSMPYIRLGTLTELPVPLPSLPEQQRIAEFFSALDEQIELTENKLTLLKEQKKGYLQGIFG